MIKEQLPIHKQYLVISAPTSFSLVANNGTDKVYRPSGIWQLDCYKLLPEKFMKNYPVFVLELEYDEEKIPEGFAFEYYFTNLNLGDSLKGVSGDLVELPESQLEKLKEVNISEDSINALLNNNKGTYLYNNIFDDDTIPKDFYLNDFFSRFDFSVYSNPLNFLTSSQEPLKTLNENNIYVQRVHLSKSETGTGNYLECKIMYIKDGVVKTFLLSSAMSEEYNNFSYFLHYEK